MKKLLLMVFAAVAMTANAEEKNENVVLNDANTATFVDDENVDTDDGGIKLGKGKDDDDRWSMHLAVGVDIPVSTNGVDFAPFRSWDINWTVVQYDYTPKKSKTTLSVGLGFDWRNYTLSGHDHAFIKESIINPDAASYANSDETVDVISSAVFGSIDNLSSRIHTVSLSMPLLIKQRFGKSFAISLGAQLNWNYYARIHNYYELGDEEIDVYTKKIGHRPFTVDVLGIIHIAKGFGVYCKYSPMSVLKKDKGPEFKSLSVGFYF